MTRVIFAILAMVCGLNAAKAADLPDQILDEIKACITSTVPNFNKTMLFCQFQIGLGIESAALVDLSTLKVHETGLVAVGGFTYSPNESTVVVNKNINCRLNPGEVIETLSWNGKKFVTITATQCPE